MTDAREHFEAALRLYNDTSALEVGSGPGSRAVNTLQALGRVSLAEGNIAEARAQAETAFSLARNANDRWAAECHFVLGSIHLHQAERDAAEVRFRESLGIRQRVGHAAGVVESLVGLGRVREAAGDWVQARDLYHSALEVAGGMDPNPYLVSALRHFGLLLVHHFDRDEGAALIRRAVAIVQTMPRSREYAPTLLALGSVEAAPVHD